MSALRVRLERLEHLGRGPGVVVVRSHEEEARALDQSNSPTTAPPRIVWRLTPPLDDIPH